ncbi:MAG: substrate-binding domain-containing protein [Anaerolineae bacterium]|nr:substrate-binding domain-containing protein [Anaerolineae bacterium]
MRRWPAGLLALTSVLVACAAPVALIPTPTAQPVTVTPQIVQIVCPESLAPLLMALASAYQHEEPAAQIVVVERADELALHALTNGDAGIAALTWLPATAPENTWRATFARDGLAVIVNPQNGLPGVTMEQLRLLFGGRVEDWASWEGLPGPPQIISREEASGDFDFFQAHVMHDTRVTLTALLAPTSLAAHDSVSQESLAVGYLSTAWLDGQVRALAIEGVPPSPETIAAGLYPLSRELFLVTMGEPQEMARAFIQWALTPDGQTIVATHSFVPVLQ